MKYLHILDYNTAFNNVFKIPCSVDVDTFLKEQGFNEDEIAYMVTDSLNVNLPDLDD